MLNNNNSHFIELLIFYKHRNPTFLKVLGYVVYCLIEKYISLDCIGLQKD